MSTPPVTVPADETLSDAIAAMLENSVGSAIVVDRSMVGIITRCKLPHPTSLTHKGFAC
jgi:CBS domain-containing protein